MMPRLVRGALFIGFYSNEGSVWVRGGVRRVVCVDGLWLLG